MLLHQDLTEEIIGAYYEVYNTLGFGHLEKVYENSLAYELELRGIKCEQQQRIIVRYKGKVVGDYFADICVEDKVILELKAASNLLKENECQLTNYLKSTVIEVGFLFNFGLTPTFKRKIFTNDKK